MATYYLNSGAGGAGTGADWTNAFTTLADALAAATSNNDIIKVHKTHTEELGADTTFTLGANISIVCVDKDASDALATMGTAAWIGNSTTAREVGLTGGRTAYFYGLTFRTAAVSTLKDMFLTRGDGCHHEFESCYFWHGNTATTSRLRMGTLADTQTYSRSLNCTFRLGHVNQQIVFGGRNEIIGGSISSDGAAITTVFSASTTADAAGADLLCTGFDISATSATATLLANSTIVPATLIMDRCPLPTGAYTILDTQSNSNLSAGQVYLRDCSTGDVHGVFGYADPLGSVVTDSSIYYTSGAAGQSWKIVTTGFIFAAGVPFRTPPISKFVSAGGTITPWFEILRNNATTALTDAEVWAEFEAKTVSGSCAATHFTDRAIPTVSATNQANGAGLGSWTGEGGTAWSGKIDSGSSISIAEAGDLTGRICVAPANTTLYVDPFIRT